MNKYIFFLLLALVGMNYIFPNTVKADTSRTNHTQKLQLAENDGFWSGTKEVADDTWKGTKDVTSDVWKGAKEVTSDVWDGTKKVARDVKDGITGNDAENSETPPNTHQDNNIDENNNYND